MTQPSFTDEQAMEGQPMPQNDLIERLRVRQQQANREAKFGVMPSRLYGQAADALAQRDAEIAALNAHKLRLERAIIRLSAPDLLTQAEREALSDFIKFMRDQGDDTVNQSLREPKNISPKERFK